MKLSWKAVKPVLIMLAVALILSPFWTIVGVIAVAVFWLTWRMMKLRHRLSRRWRTLEYESTRRNVTVKGR